MMFTRHTPKLILALFIVLAITLGLSCGKKLTREKAAKMIVEKNKYPQDVIRMTRTYYGLLHLENAGYINLSYDPYRIPSEIISITEKGKKLGLEVARGEYSINVQGKVCKKVFLGLTGMRTNADKTVDVEFTWKYDSVTPLCEIITDPRDPCRSSETRNGTCRFALYDDGWRIESLEEYEQ